MGVLVFICFLLILWWGRKVGRKSEGRKESMKKGRMEVKEILFIKKILFLVKYF